MTDKKLSQSLQEKFKRIEEAGETGKNIKAGLGSSMMLGAGIAGLGGKSMMGGAAAGLKAGSIAALLVMGASGIATLIKKARQDGASETKHAIRRAMANAEQSKKYTNTQKAAIRNNGAATIARIDKAVKPMKKMKEAQEEQEFLVDGPADKDVITEVPESLGKSILEKLSAIIEDENSRKAAAAGAIAGATVGHAAKKQLARRAVKKATTQRSLARKAAIKSAANTKAAVNKAGAAKTILNKETRLAGQLAKKNPSGIVDKLKNHGARLAQKGRVKAASKNLAGHPEVAKALNKQGKAVANLDKTNQALKGAKKALRKVGKLGGAGKGALVGAALGAGAYGLHKLANK